MSCFMIQNILFSPCHIQKHHCALKWWSLPRIICAPRSLEYFLTEPYQSCSGKIKPCVDHKCMPLLVNQLWCYPLMSCVYCSFVSHKSVSDKHFLGRFLTIDLGDHGWGYQISVRLGKFSILKRYMLDSWNHIYVWRMSSQLSCGDICQIWTWYLIGKLYVDNSDKLGK